jgi:hypothetical protein
MILKEGIWQELPLTLDVLLGQVGDVRMLDMRDVAGV